MQRVVGEAPRDDRLDLLVCALVPELSRSRAASLVRRGLVSVDGAAERRPGARIAAGRRLQVEIPPPVPMDALPQDIPLSIVYQDEALLVVDKPAGLVVHPAPGHPDGTLVNALLHHTGALSEIGGVQRPGIVHRLDRGTSGLMVVARHDAAHRALSEQFARKEAGRCYLALCLGAPPSDAGTASSLLARHPKDRLRFASGPRGKAAVTHWQVLARAGTVSLVGCRLETGRTHQVRVHLAEQGCPLIGDPLYGRRGARLPATLRGRIDPDRPLLHAWSLAFAHPDDGRPMRFVAPPPSDFLDALQRVGIGLDALPGPVREALDR